MITIKKYLKSIIYIISSLIITNLFLTILSYNNIIDNNLYKYLKLLFIIISLLIGGLNIGKNSNNKGYKEGIKIGIIIIIIEIIINLLFIHNIKFKILIYYLITVSSTTLGSIIGINKKIKSK